MKTKISTLKNGMRVVSLKNDSGISYLTIAVRCGSCDENPKNNGISHFVEHMLFNGTKSLPKKEFREKLEDYGIEYNAETSSLETIYSFDVLSLHEVQALELMSDMIQNPSFEKEWIAKEKRVVCQEAIDSQDDDLYQLSEDMICFNASKETFFIIGPRLNITNFSRDDLLKHWEKFYTPPNMVLSFCGSLPHEEVVKKAEELFTNNNNSENIREQKITYRGGIGKTPSSAETSVSISFDTHNNNFYSLLTSELLSMVLGEIKSSRLSSCIRESHGFAYNTGSSIIKVSDCEIFELYAECSENNFYNIIKLMSEEIANIYTNEVSANELNRAKKALIFNYIRNYQKPYSHSKNCARRLLEYNSIYEIGEIIDGINKITSKDILLKAKTIFKGKPTIIYRGKNLKKIPKHIIEF